jgi:hypothetical protein
MQVSIDPSEVSLNGSGAGLSPAQTSLEPYLSSTLMTALSAARSSGCCVANGSIRELADWLAARSGGGLDREAPAKIVLGRPKDPPVQVLTPLDPSQAAPRSLSAKFGTGPLPFHADGSHLDEPPHFVLLEAENPGEDHAPTHLLRLFPPPDTDMARDIRHGVFRVDTGTSAFYATCRSGDSQAIRFDLGCMSPIDPRSRRLTQTIVDAEPDYTHTWSAARRVLIIDNRQVLHARANADAPTNRSLLRLMLTEQDRLW